MDSIVGMELKMAQLPAKKWSMSSPWNEVGVHGFHMESIRKIAGSVKTSFISLVSSAYFSFMNSVMIWNLFFGVFSLGFLDAQANL